MCHRKIDCPLISEMQKEKLHKIIYGNALKQLFPLLEPYGDICLIVDANVREGFAAELIEELSSVRSQNAGGSRLKSLCVFEASESRKNLESVEKIVCKMIQDGLNRDAFVLAVGGGITSDVAGFAASIFKRGVKFAFVPTTLLAQCDAAIGGKNGVNVCSYKNMAGVFRMPEFVFICNEALKTLDKRQLLTGVAEMLKSFIIADADAYARTVELFTSDCGESFFPRLGELASKAAAIKAEIVSADPYENGQRRLLNLGHTFAHAIEALAAKENRSVTHGEAVAAGIVLSAGLSSDSLLADRLRKDFKAVGLPVESPYSISQMASYMTKDKKAEAGLVHFIVPQSIGHCEIKEMTVAEAVNRITEAKN